MKKRMGNTIKNAMKYLNLRKFNAHYAENGDTAKKIVMDLVPLNASIGFGDSSSVRQIGITAELKKRGNIVINPFEPAKQIEDYEAYSRNVFRSTIKAAFCEIFITGTNVITEDGRLVNIDGVGNRVSGMIWGHPKVILLVGKNKIVKDLDAAMHRLKKVIAPEHVSRRRSSNSPCQVKGECMDCSGASRVCNVTTIMEGAPIFSDIHVVIVDEDLGLGFDRSWSKDRINKISKRHNSHMWSMPEEAIQALTKEELWVSVCDLLRYPVEQKS